jgi:hypothetical protein
VGCFGNPLFFQHNLPVDNILNISYIEDNEEKRYGSVVYGAAEDDLLLPRE